MLTEARNRGPGQPPPAQGGAASAGRPAAIRLPATPVQVLTVKQPWAYAITSLGKRIENRSWRLPRGFLWLHAGARSGWDPAAPRHRPIATAWQDRHGPSVPLSRGTDLIPFGAVAALIRVTGHHHATDCDQSPEQILTHGHVYLCDEWAAHGQVHNEFDLLAVLPEPVPADGMRRLWLLPAATEAACRTQLVQGQAALRFPAPASPPGRPVGAATGRGGEVP